MASSVFKPFPRVRSLSPLVILMSVLMAGVAMPASAHEAQWSVVTNADTITIDFSYTDGHPMAFAAIKVQSPDGTIFQVGNTDRSGSFSFLVPADARPGEPWQVEAVGEEQHLVVAEVNPDIDGQATSFRQNVMTGIMWLFVISVLVNIALISMAIERRLQRHTENSAIS